MAHTLLLAEDNVAVHQFVELTCAGEGIEVVSVTDGEQPVEQLIARRPDIRFRGRELTEARWLRCREVRSAACVAAQRSGRAPDRGV
jgi:DNA-binding response OmpR family regulator